MHLKHYICSVPPLLPAVQSPLQLAAFVKAAYARWANTETRAIQSTSAELIFSANLRLEPFIVPRR